MNNRWVLLATILVAAFAVLILPAALAPKHARMPSGMRVSCEAAATEMLVSPSTAKIGARSTPAQYGNEWRYGFTTDSQNAFGAMVRTSWVCVDDGGAVSVTPR